MGTTPTLVGLFVRGNEVGFRMEGELCVSAILEVVRLFREEVIVVD